MFVGETSESCTQTAKKKLNQYFERIPPVKQTENTDSREADITHTNRHQQSNTEERHDIDRQTDRGTNNRRQTVRRHTYDQCSSSVPCSFILTRLEIYYIFLRPHVGKRGNEDRESMDTADEARKTDNTHTDRETIRNSNVSLADAQGFETVI